MKFVLLDLRMLENNESNEIGFLPLMISLDREELISEDINDIITKKYINQRGKYHFIFLTTNTEDFFNFEESFYKVNIFEVEEKKYFSELTEKNIEKEFIFNSEQITKKQIP